jgi:hypothetical protein
MLAKLLIPRPGAVRAFRFPHTSPYITITFENAILANAAAKNIKKTPLKRAQKNRSGHAATVQWLPMRLYTSE